MVYYEINFTYSGQFSGPKHILFYVHDLLRPYVVPCGRLWSSSPLSGLLGIMGGLLKFI